MQELRDEEGLDGEDDNEEFSSFFQGLLRDVPEPDCIDKLMNSDLDYYNPEALILVPAEEELSLPEPDPPHLCNIMTQTESTDDAPGPGSMESSSSVNLCNDSAMIQTKTSDVKVPDPGSVEKKEMRSGCKRKKSQLWTKEEHLGFLLGLEKGLEGNWKEMAKSYVPTRLSSQIASHAQKYFKRQENINAKRRKSINDISLSDLHKISMSMSDQPNPKMLPKPEQVPNMTLATTRASFTAPSYMRQNGPFLGGSLPQPNPNTNFPALTNPKRVMAVEEARALYMGRQQSSSNYMYPPILNHLPQPNPRVPNFAMKPPPDQLTPLHEVFGGGPSNNAYFSAEQVSMWRHSSNPPPLQPQTLMSVSPQHGNNSYNYNYASPMFTNPNGLDTLQQSQHLDYNAAETPQIIPFSYEVNNTEDLPKDGSTWDKFHT